MSHTVVSFLMSTNEPSDVSKGKAFKLMDKKGHSGIQDYLPVYEMLAWLVPNL